MRTITKRVYLESQHHTVEDIIPHMHNTYGWMDIQSVSFSKMGKNLYLVTMQVDPNDTQFMKDSCSTYSVKVRPRQDGIETDETGFYQ